MNSVLVAGVGDVLRGDDGFGVEVALRMAARPLPANVEVRNFGVRCIDLTYALLDSYDAAVVIDATSRGGKPGTIYVVEPEPEETGPGAAEHVLRAPHDLDSAKVLQAVRAMDGRCRRIVLVGCEPESRGGREGRIGLSKAAAGAVDPVIEAVESLLSELTEWRLTETGGAPAGARGA